MALDLTQNLSFEQAVRRSMPVWNLRGSYFGRVVGALSDPQPDSVYNLFPPAYSIRGIAIAPDSDVRSCLLRFQPAGVPKPPPPTTPPTKPAFWNADGSTFLCTHNQPLLVPFTGPCSVLAYTDDIWQDGFLNLAGANANFGAALLNPPLLSLYVYLKIDPILQGGQRRDHAEPWKLFLVENGADGQLLEVIPTFGRKSIRISFEGDVSSNKDITVQMTGVNKGREVLLPFLSTPRVIAGAGHTTVIHNLNTQFLLIRASSANDDPPVDANLRYQYELRDGTGCCNEEVDQSTVENSFGAPAIVRYTAEGGESSFTVPFAVARASDNYDVFPGEQGVANFITVDAPDINPGDRTTAGFLVETSGPLTAGDVISFIVADR